MAWIFLLPEWRWHTVSSRNVWRFLFWTEPLSREFIFALSISGHRFRIMIDTVYLVGSMVFISICTYFETFGLLICFFYHNLKNRLRGKLISNRCEQSMLIRKTWEHSSQESALTPTEIKLLDKNDIKLRVHVLFACFFIVLVCW